MRILGVDVSHYQGRIDWEALRSSRADFAIVKATQAGVNPEFRRNWSEAHRVGVPVGAYHLAETKKPAPEQAWLYLSTVDLRPGDFPAVLDLETNQIDAVGAEKAHAWILDWCEEVERATGQPPILYLSPRGVDHLEGHTEGLERFPLWIVAYRSPEPGLQASPPVPAPWIDWLLWQWTSSGNGPDYGCEPGNVDLDYFHGCRHELADWLAAHAPENTMSVDIEAALRYNSNRGYSRQLVSEILGFVEADPWYSEQMIQSIARWQYNQGGLTVDGKVGPSTLQAMIDQGLQVP